MSIDEGMKAIDAILTAPNWDIGRLISAARDRVLLEFGTGPGLPQGLAFGLSRCQTFYGATPQGTSQELIAWCLAILLAEYTAGLLGKKAEEGHCQEHRKLPDYEPCADMSKEHMRMLGLFKDRLKKLITEIETLERQTQLPSAPATSGS